MIEDSNLLASLRPADREIFLPYMTECALEAGTVLYEPGDAVEYCYFPRGNAIGSFFVLLENGMAVETTMVGREGALGGIVSNGHTPAFARSNVMHSGSFYRIAASDLDEVKRNSAQVRHLFARYADCMMAQVFQSIACNATHTIEQRAAKWLTAAVERTGHHDITMTQEQLASMMGIGRSYASRVVQRFKADRLVRTRRGGIAVLDREGLKDRACSCNDQVKRHFETVLGGVYPN